MLPIILPQTSLHGLVIGQGAATNRRLEMLVAAGVTHVYLPTPPSSDFDFSPFSILFVADFDDETSKIIYNLARPHIHLINTEDKNQFCTFHVPAIVRRGHLLLTASTGGTAPRLARKAKKVLETMFDESFSEKTDILAAKRAEYKASGIEFLERAEKTEADIAELNMFASFCDKCKNA